MMKRWIWPVAVLALSLGLSGVAQAEEAMRMHGKHEHGHGTLNIAIQENVVLMELHAPGADIVGFEHEAKTAEDKASVEKARSLLKTPLRLFTLPGEAACRVDKAEVTLSGGDESEHKHEHEHEKGSHKKHGEHEKHEEYEKHSEFHAEYKLICVKPQAIRSLKFPFFAFFPGSRELDVTVLKANGQAVYEVERDKPAIDLELTR